LSNRAAKPSQKSKTADAAIQATTAG
jgi:hypothetical protein